jgi:nucleoside-diphosphate-sugar epimerase
MSGLRKKISAVGLANRSIAWKTVPSMERSDTSINQQPRRALILGFGYVGSRVGQMLAERGVEVWAVSRTKPAAIAESEGHGIHWYGADLTEPGTLAGLSGNFDDVLFSASSSRGTMEDYEDIYCRGLQYTMDWLIQTKLPKRFVYLSSTGVYGQDDGNWVDETMPTEPDSQTGRILVRAEKLVCERYETSGFPGMILRLSGIYGPGRGYALKRILNGDAVIELPGDRWVNMIHRDDAAMAVISALESGVPGETYNVTDNEPVQQRAFYEWLAKSSGMPVPPCVENDPSKPGKRRVTSKRISNSKISKLSQFNLKYPAYRDGYAQLLLPWT